MRAQPYEASMQGQWDEFVDSARNGTFLFRREYMDYHADRFPDASLIIADDRGQWLAILPATRQGGRLSSHGGLTYGGFVTGARMTAPLMLSAFDCAAGYLVETNVEEVLYKPVPHIYHAIPAEEELYALFRVGARLVRRDISSVIDLKRRGPVQERRERGIRRARKAGLQVASGLEHAAAFWGILEETLTRRHGVKPVHTLDEYRLLSSRLPNDIILYVALHEGAVVAGIAMYLTKEVAHAQYIASSEAGRDLGALDFLFDTVIEAQSGSSRRYFDFGISTESAGQHLNVGLVDQKEGFGARSVVYDQYVWSVRPGSVFGVEVHG